jgi:hypothetical protein
MADLAKILGKASADIDKVLGVDALTTISTISGIDWVSVPYIPEGLIIPLAGAGAVPAGWTIFTAADNKHIIGAGSSYNPGDNGAGSGNINMPHTSTGTHIGSQWYFVYNAGGDGITADPNHTHSTMTFTSPDPGYTEWRLIKADGVTVDLPGYGAFWKHSAAGWAGLTRFTGGAGRNFKANTARADSAGKSSMTVTSAFRGAHDHDGRSGGSAVGGGTASYYTTYDGNHQHSFTANLSFTLYQSIMSMWYMNHATNPWTVAGTNFIGLYQSTTPPDGWSLCDGTGGTPDLRNRFAGVPAADSGFGSSGDGKVACSSVTNTTGSHDHRDAALYCGGCTPAYDYHISFEGSHAHTMTLDTAWLPAYYSLAFIMYTG